MLKHKKVVYILLGIVVMAIIALISNYARQQTVDAFPVRKGEIQKIIEVRGIVELGNKETVYSQLTGTIEELKVEEGDKVHPGFIAGSFSSQDLKLAQDKALAQLKHAQAVEAAAWEEYTYKKELYEKNEVLYESGAIPKQDLKELETQLNITELKARGDKAAREQAEVALQEITNNMEKLIISSDSGGVILTKYVEEGAVVQAGAPLLEIGDNTTVYIRVDVLSDDVTEMELGQEAIISGDVLGLSTIKGKIYYIAPKAEKSISSLGVEQQRVEVRIKIQDMLEKFKAGYGVDVDIVIGEKKDTLYIPEKAIFKLNGTDTVFVIEGERLELRTVQKGIENTDYTEVLAGVAEGEQVVLDPPEDLKPGMRVRSE